MCPVTHEEYNYFVAVISKFLTYLQSLQSVRRSTKEKKLPVESAQRRPILCFEFSDFVEPL